MNQSFLTLDYRENLGPTESPPQQENHSCKWFTTEYNSINTGTSEVIVGSKCGPLARIEKQNIS